ncbi:hydroxymethylbilane synthase [Anaerovorax odorimutans]|uniref:Porphobilinogen deaminase n=1 Tax=Anaerovorax odorimutans TaxID=109327 RepID=A0ABT1RMG9_9FIRM|nr:hydroxymethylbilane synthase [Anaerovorax odorimutans]MCQ4636374.1 hydroxymethylbilane synthase [Anaerovorax odorimutans]
MKKKKVIVGSRDSKLAVIQSRLVMEQIEKHHPELELELLTMKTTGDKILDKTLDKIGGKGLFVKELDRALRARQIDISVHSLKDMPMEVPEDLPLLAFPKRENAADVLVLPEGVSCLDKSKPLGSSSPRRNVQLRKLYPDMGQKSVRGNVQTRLRKLDSGEYSGLVLAYAGLKRLDLEGRVSRVFSPDEMIPAAGQGTMVVQGRAGEDYSYLDCVDDPEARAEAGAERAFVSYLEGGCSAPIGAFAEIQNQEIRIRGLYFNEKTGELRTGNIAGPKDQGEELAVRLAKQLKGESEA